MTTSEPGSENTCWWRRGSAARIGCDVPDAPVDAAIVGIVDDASRLE